MYKTTHQLTFTSGDSAIAQAASPTAFS